MYKSCTRTKVREGSLEIEISQVPNYRVSNLKYESVRFDFKAVVFIRANPGKKETTDRSGSHVNFIQKQCTFPEVVSPEKWYVTNIKSWA